MAEVENVLKSERDEGKERKTKNYKEVATAKRL
jgi:hypothetical protein